MTARAFRFLLLGPKLGAMRRFFAFAAFVTVVMSVVVGAHVYVWRRLVVDPLLPAPIAGALAVALAGLGLSIVAQPFSERVLPLKLARRIAWPAFTWMGIAFLLLTFLGLSDLVLWSIRTFWLDALTETQLAGLNASAWQAIAVVAITAVLTVVGMRNAIRPPDLKQVEVRLERWPASLDGFRILQISDIHIGPMLGRRFAERLVARCNEADADLIAVTGDLVDGSVKQLKDEVAPFGELQAKHGVFFATGNHDHYSNAESWSRFLASELGFRVLRNEHVPVAGFLLAGTDDHRGGMGGSSEDLDAALADRDADKAVVLLAHDPSTFPAAVRYDIDLQISGHTHGGQIWPWGALVWLAIRYVAGLYRRDRSTLYVSRGTGFWGPPIRLLAPAEITVLTLRPQG